MIEFLQTPWGIAVLALFITAVSLAVIELNYKFFFKYLLDFIFALICCALLIPVWIVLAIVGKIQLNKHGGGKILQQTAYLGSGGKTVYLTSYALQTANGEKLAHADFLQKSGLVNLPKLLNILQGKMSFVGIVALPLRNRNFIDDEHYARFDTRIGLCSPLAYGGNTDITYEEVFVAESKYVKRRELFYDIGVVLQTIVTLIRGEGKSYLGEVNATNDYCDVLLARGEITAEQVEDAENNTK